MAFAGDLKQRIAERLAEGQLSDLQTRVKSLEDRVRGQDTDISGLLSNIRNLTAENATLRQQISDIVQGRVPSIFYDIEVGKITANLISKTDFDAWRSQFQTSLNQTIQSLDGAISDRIKTALNNYTPYLYNTALFDDGFTGTLLSLRDMASMAGRFKLPFTGTTAPFRTFFSNLPTRLGSTFGQFNFARDAMDGLRANFANIGTAVQAVREDIHALREAFAYTRDAAVWLRGRTAGLSPNVADVADTYRSIFEYLRAGGTWYAHAEGGIPWASQNFGPVTFKGTSTYFDSMKSNFLQGRDRFDLLKGQFNTIASQFSLMNSEATTLFNGSRTRLGW